MTISNNVSSEQPELKKHGLSFATSTIVCTQFCSETEIY